MMISSRVLLVSSVITGAKKNRRYINNSHFSSIVIDRSCHKAKKKICGFPVSSYKNLGSTGRSVLTFFF